MPRREPLPIDSLEPALHAAVQHHRRFLLAAPTGSGKSTRIPQMLLKMPEQVHGSIVVLQPRRVAARMLARRVSQELESPLGEVVGYNVRFDNRSSKETRILYVTEGLLLRRLMTSGNLDGIGALLFDEFHERHLDGDLSLALALKLQKTTRPDLILGVMSATLDVEALAGHLNPCATLRAEGRTFPVAIRFVKAGELKREIPVWDQAARAFRQLEPELEEGHVLIFMPGVYEIRRTLEALRALPEARKFELHALYGELPPEQQDAAIRGGERRKIIVTTNVAETSLTIEGVRAVIDSGLARVLSFEPARGINTLLVGKISQASADQRAGRAGRTGPGICVRLWTETDHAHRPAQISPEIARLDLAEPTLLLACLLNRQELETFPWVEPPPPDSWERALRLLRDLGAIEPAAEAVTPLGRLMARFPLHPRWSRLLLAADERGCLQIGALMAALCQERSLILPLTDRRRELEREESILRSSGVTSDLFLELNAWEALRSNGFNHDFARQWGLHAQRARTAGDVAKQLLRLATEARLGQHSDEPPAAAETDQALRECILLAFSDGVARRRDRGSLRCDLVHGRRGELARHSTVHDATLLVSTEVQERQKGSAVSLLLSGNTKIERAWLENLFPEAFSDRMETCLDPSTRRAVAVNRVVFRDLVLEEREVGEPDPEVAAQLFADSIERGECNLKNWNDGVENWIARVNFLAAVCADYGFTEIGRGERRFLLEQICHGARSYRELKDRDVWPHLRDWLPAGLNSEVDRLAPERLELAKGGRARLEYSGGSALLSATVQQLYDTSHASLAIAEGRVRPKIQLLAPNRRPVQITADLDAFWETSYAAVKKELRGRYPKHEWR